MSNQQIQDNKLQLIHWITELEDAKLIEALMEFQVKNNDIPQWQRDEVDRISEGIDNGSINTRSWDEAKQEIFKK